MSILKSTNSGVHQPITPEKLKELGYYIFWSAPSGTTVYIKRDLPVMQITHGTTNFLNFITLQLQLFLRKDLENTVK